MKFRVKRKDLADLKIINPGVKYFGDGTGRDGYVVVNYGGTVKKHIPRNQILKEFTDNKAAFQHNRSRSQKSFTGNPNFTRKRPEFQIKSMHKVTSQGGTMPEYNNPYPQGVTIERANTAALLSRTKGDLSKYRGEHTAAALGKLPFNTSQSLDPGKWQQVLAKNMRIPHNSNFWYANKF